MQYVHIYQNIPPAESSNDPCCTVTPCSPTSSPTPLQLPPQPSHCQLGESSFQMPLLWFWRRAMSGSTPTSKMFCLIWSVSSRSALQVALGSCGDSTRTLNQRSDMTYDNLSKSDSAESLLFLRRLAEGTQQTSGRTTLPGPGNVETFQWLRFSWHRLSRITTESLPRHWFSDRACLQYLGSGECRDRVLYNDVQNVVVMNTSAFYLQRSLMCVANIHDVCFLLCGILI